MGVKTELILPS